MRSSVISANARAERTFPAYGPIDAILGFVVFYIFLTRATPTIVDVLTTVLPDVSASVVQFGLAAFLWFVFLMTTFDQVRRQLAALGVGSKADIRESRRSRGVPSTERVVLYLVALLVGGLVSMWTFDSAIDAGISMIRVVATLDIAAVPVVDFAVMIVFFVSFGVVTHVLDRMVIGALRAITSS
ncbi:hypothetical protein KU306_18565 (plasmid) [Haloferax larsenii]|uniref:Tripartite ATP-independent transporter, DctQ component n=1 Tax=Haloferax larsenii TaxID=302484 RepID=A0ABY5RIY8_HALLR|nr:hypothetical protein KU306_18565 [Haloferax larsenii]